MKRFIAVQIGARRNYAIPVILAKASMLEALYTDMCANVGVGATLDKWLPGRFKTGSVAKLLDRRVPPDVKDICTFDFSMIQYFFLQQLAGNSAERLYQKLTIFDRNLSRSMIHEGVKGATHVFSMFGEAVDFVVYAKKNGLKVVIEIYLSPLTHEIVQMERKLFAELENPLPSQIIESDHIKFSQICNASDNFIVPSQFVVDGLSSLGVPNDKCQIVPYTVSNSWFSVKNLPIKGRVLFVGTAEIRKGIHVLAMASKRLAHQGYEFRIAGGVSETIQNHLLTQHLKFLGRVPRSLIKKEYEQADFLVLPTLAEGSAEVIYEALAAGLPVITTYAAGSVVRDGIEGFIVPERNDKILAHRIEELVENRELRQRMSIAARERAKDYTWDKYAERLLKALKNV
jgi:glycosyltransferase involved in cell wall biosynthesis